MTLKHCLFKQSRDNYQNNYHGAVKHIMSLQIQENGILTV